MYKVPRLHHIDFDVIMGIRKETMNTGLSADDEAREVVHE